MNDFNKRMGNKGHRDKSGKLVISCMIVIAVTLFVISGCSDDESANPISNNDGGGGTPPDTVFYSDVQPIFSGNCAGSTCHIGAISPGAGLRLDTRTNILAGSSGGAIAVVISGDGANSELYKRVAGISTPRMPLNSSPLSQASIDKIKKWIDDGLLE